MEIEITAKLNELVPITSNLLSDEQSGRLRNFRLARSTAFAEHRSGKMHNQHAYEEEQVIYTAAKFFFFNLFPAKRLLRFVQ